MAKRRRRRGGLGLSTRHHENVAHVRSYDVRETLDKVKADLNAKDCVGALDKLITANRLIAEFACEARSASNEVERTHISAIRAAQDRAEELLNQVHACRSSTSRR